MNLNFSGGTFLPDFNSIFEDYRARPTWMISLESIFEKNKEIERKKMEKEYIGGVLIDKEDPKKGFLKQALQYVVHKDNDNWVRCIRYAELIADQVDKDKEDKGELGFTCSAYKDAVKAALELMKQLTWSESPLAGRSFASVVKEMLELQTGTHEVFKND